MTPGSTPYVFPKLLLGTVAACLAVVISGVLLDWLTGADSTTGAAANAGSAQPEAPYGDRPGCADTCRRLCRVLPSDIGAGTISCVDTPCLSICVKMAAEGKLVK